MGLLLHDDRSIGELAAMADIARMKVGQVTAPKFAVKTKVEKSQFFGAMLHLQRYTDGLNVLRLEQCFLADDLALVPRSTCKHDFRRGNFSCRADIIRAMRRGLSFMLVMLLILRGLLGDAMAMDMVPVTLPSALFYQHMPMAGERGMANHDQDHVGATGHAPGTASTAACPEDAAASASDCCHASGPTCSVCGICHSALFSPDSVAQALLPQLRSLHLLGSTHFASAPAALAIKPPIS